MLVFRQVFGWKIRPGAGPDYTLAVTVSNIAKHPTVLSVICIMRHISGFFLASTALSLTISAMELLCGKRIF